MIPVAETTFEFVMSEKPLHVRLSLPKEVSGGGGGGGGGAWSGGGGGGGVPQRPVAQRPVPPVLSLQTFYHGEAVPVSVEISNSSSRSIKDISLSGELLPVGGVASPSVMSDLIHPIVLTPSLGYHGSRIHVDSHITVSRATS